MLTLSNNLCHCRKKIASRQKIKAKKGTKEKLSYFFSSHEIKRFEAIIIKGFIFIMYKKFIVVYYL